MITIETIFKKDLSGIKGLSPTEIQILRGYIGILGGFYAINPAEVIEHRSVENIKGLFILAFYLTVHFLLRCDDNIQPKVFCFFGDVVEKFNDKYKNTTQELSAEDLERIAMIFQTATDRSKIDGKSITKKILNGYLQRAQQYLQLAAEKHIEEKSLLQRSHYEKMQVLYLNASRDSQMFCVKKELEIRANECQINDLVERSKRRSSFLGGLFSSSGPKMGVSVDDSVKVERKEANAQGVETAPLLVSSTDLTMLSGGLFQRHRQIQAISEAITRNDPIAKYELAQRLEASGGSSNYLLSLQYYKDAAEQSHAGACFKLARLNLQGNVLEGIAKDYKLAEYYAKKGMAGKGIKKFEIHQQEEQVKFCEGILKTITADKEMSESVSKSKAL